MQIKTRLTGYDLTEGIGFYGETIYDNATVARLRQLAVVLEEVVFHLADLDRQVEGSCEGSAKAIKRQLNIMRKDLLLVAFDEGMAADIIELLGGEEE